MNAAGTEMPGCIVRISKDEKENWNRSISRQERSATVINYGVCQGPLTANHILDQKQQKGLPLGHPENYTGQPWTSFRLRPQPLLLNGGGGLCQGARACALYCRQAYRGHLPVCRNGQGCGHCALFLKRAHSNASKASNCG